MQIERLFHPEHLRPAAFVCTPDPRSIGFVTLDSESGDFRQVQVSDHHKAVALYSLHKGVPEDVAIHFDTARNLYLYAWFVYRFFPVAEHQALACLELALRERLGKEIPKTYYPRAESPTLKPLLRYAVDKGYVRNEGFKRWHEAAQFKARMRYEKERGDEMREKGLDRIELDYSEVQVTDIDRNHDYISDLIDILPMFRNEYAHGSKMLHRNVLGTMQTVSEIVNQIYPEINDVSK